MIAPRRRRTGPLAASLALALTVTIVWASAGCGEAFPPETQVDRLRILGIRAEPPEVSLLASTSLDALVVDPHGEGRALRLTWGVCLVELEAAATDIPCPGPDSYPLSGNGASAQLSLPELLTWLEEMGFDVDPAGGEVPDVDDIPLFVGLEASAGAESVRALKRVKVRLQGDQAFNTNPRLAGLEMDGLPVTDGLPALIVGEKHELNPLVTEDSRDLFWPDDAQEERLEDLLFSWFSTGGDFENQRTILDADRSGTPLQVNDWRLPDEPGLHQLWVVVRDGRYGIDWREFSFDISE